MPVEFLTDDEAAAFVRHAENLFQAEPARVFLLAGEGTHLFSQHRGDHMKVGFAPFISRPPC